MRITVTVKANSREEKVERMSQPSLGFDDVTNEKVIYKVSVKETPVDGKANAAVTRALANYFNIPQSLIQLISGQTYKQKVFEVEI